MSTEPKNKGGRPPKPDEERREQRSIRLLPRQWRKIDAAGKAEFEAYLDRWEVQPKPAKKT